MNKVTALRRLMTASRSTAYHCVLLLLALMLGGIARASAETQLSDARLWPAPGHTKLVLDLSGRIDHSVFTLEKPDRLVIDMQDTHLAVDLTRLSLKDTPIQDIRSAPRHGNDLRVVLDLKHRVSPRSFLLDPNSQYGYRLIVDMRDPNVPDGDQPAVIKDTSARGKRNIVVCIDAGHGGEDPGAIGPDGFKEKNVTLHIARDLQALVSAQRGYTAKMTRTGDYYVGLRDRTLLARKYNADMFISIHADSFPSADAEGASVYALSRRGATSETARWLAQSENRADLIGGTGGVSLDDKSNTLAQVLLDLSMTASMKASLGVGRDVLGKLDDVTPLHRDHVEQAAFVVLKSPDIPSILVETGFISNPREEHQLVSPAHQHAIARAIFAGIERYFAATPPPGTLMAWDKQRGRKTATAMMQHYKVRSGDTLSSIAAHNQTSVQQLRKLNGLDSDMVVVGQVLQVPAS